jgi:malonyl-CoA O-methyltransferase
VTGLPGRSDVGAAYDLWAASYDTDENRTRELAGEVLRSSCLVVEGRDAVEIGCGTGGNTVWLAERARSVLGLDLSAGMLERARARIDSPAVRFLWHDVQSPWPVDDGAAGLVVALLVLEHVERLEPVFAEAARVLRPGGELFLCELHPTRQMLGRQAEFTHPETGERERVEAFLHDVSEYVNRGIEAGLELVRLGEHRDPGAAWTAPPRLLSVCFRRP